MPTLLAKKYERILTKFYVMGLLFAYFEVDKQIPIKCYFIYAYNKDYYKNKQIGKKYIRRKTLKVYKSE